MCDKSGKSYISGNFDKSGKHCNYCKSDKFSKSENSGKSGNINIYQNVGLIETRTRQVNKSTPKIHTHI